MKKELREIFNAFNGKLVGTKRMQNYVCETLSFMPGQIVRKITRTTWFLSSMDDAWAFTFTGNDLKDQHLVFLSDDLLWQRKEQIIHSIAHEIAHIILGHRNSTLRHQSREEIKRQEKEANDFVKQFVP